MARRPLLTLLTATTVLAGCASAHHAAPPAAPAVSTASSVSVHLVRTATLRRVTAVAAGDLANAVQDAAAAPFGGGAALLGGLTATDVSTADVLTATRAGSRRVGTLPTALHDAAAVTLGRFVYLFGGGTGTSQLDTIEAVDPRSGAVQPAGHLPAPSSDQAAAAIGGTAYVVGGYTGTRWLDTIVAWRPGHRARVVGHLPTAVRYAAVAAVGGRLVVAGGSLPSGVAGDAVYEYVPGSGVHRIGRLPAPTKHAAAAALGGAVYVIGGRGSALDTPVRQIVAIDPATRRIVAAGSLPQALSDAAAVAEPRGILLAGGHGRGGTVTSLTELVQGGVVRRVAASRGVPPLVDSANVYAADAAGQFSPAVRGAKPYVYVPNSDSNTVDVIDQRTFKIIRHFAVGALPQHVVPAYNLRTLYVTNDAGNSLTAIDPKTGRPERTIPVEDPYNMYFTPDGRYAIVVAERLRRLDFRNANTFAMHRSLPVPCLGADHMDFSANGRFAIVSCEFSGELLKVDIPSERVVGVLKLRPGAAPQDVKLSPDGAVFYVADMNANGVWIVDGNRFRVLRFLPTGRGAHGLYPSRDARYLYVTNRGEGSIAVVSFATRRVVKIWRIPGGGSPDMGNVSADGKILWLTGRWNGVVYAIDTRSGRLLAKIPVGAGPHGLCVWPEPGRYSLGHTGILR